jgi:two-component system sensor histidine kinase TctE
MWMPDGQVPVMPELPRGWQETCHDMRQPIASVLALAAAALAEPGLPAAARGRLELITEQTEWLAALVRHSLTAAGDGPVAARADLLSVANEAVAAECLTWPGEVKVIGPAGRVLTTVHSVLLRRMIANLLSNATRAAGASGTVTVEVTEELGMAVLRVEDTGPGFGKIETDLGLGLGAVSRSAAKHGGRLSYGNSASGGAQVSLWLPLA